MEIRFEQPGDIDGIRKANLDAFESNSEASLVDALRKADVELISLVAIEDSKIIGHILFSPVTSDSEIRISGLAPMAVRSEWQRKGIGSKLVKKGLAACRKAGYQAVVVLGYPEYYPRFGFESAKKYGINSEYDVPPEVFMVKELEEGVLKENREIGTVKYHSIFQKF